MLFNHRTSQPALLAESDTSSSGWKRPRTKFQSTPSLRRATDNTISLTISSPVSIHALLAESDLFGSIEAALVEVSIHALLAESDLFGSIEAALVEVSIHALLAESDLFGSIEAALVEVSIHALLAESDCLNGTCC